MRATAIQFSPGSDKAANIAKAEDLISRAMEDRPDLVVLPEVWSCLGGGREAKLAAAEALPSDEQPSGPAYTMLRDAARRHGIFVHGGSIGERVAGDRLRNTTVVFDGDGREVARYSKLHLFDIRGPDGHVYGESRLYDRGGSLGVFEAGGVRFGCAICYDLRFPELFAALRARGADALILPAAFTEATGRAHWDILLRARAIETQCWVVAAGTWGEHREGDGQPRRTFGHSRIVDPWGEVTASMTDGEGWVTGEIDPARAAKVRADMPLAEQRHALFAR